MTTKNMGQPVKNRFNVPVKQWNKWSNHAKKVFNNMMLSMRPRLQWMFLHPDCQPMKQEHWKTTRWNAAWTAAMAANGAPYLSGAVQDALNDSPKHKKAAPRGK